MTTLTAAQRSAAIEWETSQCSGSAAPATEPGSAHGLAQVSARAAYQLLLYRRAVLVDARAEVVRRAEGDVHPGMRPFRLELGAASLRGVLRQRTRVLVLGDEPVSSAALSELDGIEVAGVAGGMRAWREAGLPLAA